MAQQLGEAHGVVVVVKDIELDIHLAPGLLNRLDEGREKLLTAQLEPERGVGGWSRGDVGEGGVPCLQIHFRPQGEGWRWSGRQMRKQVPQAGAGDAADTGHETGTGGKGVSQGCEQVAAPNQAGDLTHYVVAGGQGLQGGGDGVFRWHGKKHQTAGLAVHKGQLRKSAGEHHDRSVPPRLPVEGIVAVEENFVSEGAGGNAPDDFQAGGPLRQRSQAALAVHPVGDEFPATCEDYSSLGWIGWRQPQGEGIGNFAPDRRAQHFHVLGCRLPCRDGRAGPGLECQRRGAGSPHHGGGIGVVSFQNESQVQSLAVGGNPGEHGPFHALPDLSGLGGPVPVGHPASGARNHGDQAGGHPDEATMADQMAHGTRSRCVISSASVAAADKMVQTMIQGFRSNCSGSRRAPISLMAWRK